MYSIAAIPFRRLKVGDRDAYEGLRFDGGKIIILILVKIKYFKIYINKLTIRNDFKSKSNCRIRIETLKCW